MQGAVVDHVVVQHHDGVSVLQDLKLVEHRQNIDVAANGYFILVVLLQDREYQPPENAVLLL